MTVDYKLGLIFAGISMICNGSFPAFSKLKFVVSCNIDPQIFNLYFIVGVIFSCIASYIVLLIQKESVDFTYLGVISGFLLALAGITTFAAIQYIGFAVGVAIWSGTAILVSFVEGLIHNPSLSNVPMTILGVILLIIGIVGVGLSEMVVNLCCGGNINPCVRMIEDINVVYGSNNPQTYPNAIGDKSNPYGIGSPNLGLDDKLITNNNGKHNNNHSKTHNNSHSIYNSVGGTDYNNAMISSPIDANNVATNDSDNEELNVLNDVVTGSPVIRQVGDDEYVDMNVRKIDKNTNDNKGPMALILGIFFAIITGFFGGSVGFPINFVEGNSKDIKFLISFAVGASIIIPITLIYGFCIKRNKISWHLKKCFIPGFLAGIVWNIGNLASLFAIPALGYNVAYPIMQSALIVGNIWGIFVFKEITNKSTILTILSFALMVIGGCVMLTIGVGGA